MLATDSNTLLAVYRPIIILLGFAKNMGLNWFIPAFVNNNVGSSIGTTGALRTNWCSLFLKYSIKDFLISDDFIFKMKNLFLC